MVYTKFSFHYIDVDTITVRLHHLEYINYPILWNNKGLYGLIPFAKIQNAFENWNNTHIGSTAIPHHKFYWHDVIKISPQIANALLGEDKDDKCTYRGKESPKSS